MTPREIEAATGAYARGVDMDNMRAGSIMATIRNTMGTGKKRKVYRWTDFFKPLTDQPQRSRRMSIAEQLALVRGQAEMFKRGVIR